MKKPRQRDADRALAGAIESANSHFEAGRLADAERAYRAVLALAAAHADALGQLGLILHAQGRDQEAADHLAASIKANPRNPATWSNCGMVLAALGRHADALAHYDRALILAPREPSILANRGNALTSLGRSAEALASYDRALAIAPDHINALYCRGNALLRQRQPAAAIAMYDRALGLKSDFMPALNNRGNARRLLGRHDLAAEDYTRAAQLAPGDAEVLSNLGTALYNLNRHQDAMTVLDAAIAGMPAHALAHYNVALVLLHLGEFARGWREYEWRWRTPFFAPHHRTFAVPQWCGEAIAGQTVLLHTEQGFGDTIQFVRYAPLVAARGARVVVEAPPELEDLLGTAAGIDQVIRHGEPLPRFDLHCPLMSLPLAFATEVATIPAQVPYLTAPPARLAQWRELINALPGPRVGLVWSGRPTHDNDVHRSIPFARLAAGLGPLLFDGKRSFVRLQTEIRDSDRDAVSQSPLIPLSRPFADFADTAAVIALLDAVVTVDTSVAHLAGALGKPAFILLPWASDFRWLMGRDDAPWYPTARLFRQPVPNDWASAIASMAAELGRGTCP
jgi:tetratricopeptide (TPR) repeat protein